MQKITKAILPVAGLGTRVMPLTLHQPKAMIGIVDKPMIHYVIDEILAAGIKHIVIVSGPYQTEFKKYFDYLKKHSEWGRLEVKFDFAVQKKPRGNGDAILSAEKFIGKNEPFLVCFSDDLLVDKKPPLKTLIELFNKIKNPLIALEPIPKKLISKYGVVRATKLWLGPDLYKIGDIVEKPVIREAPSNLGVIGRYILSPKILTFIKKLRQKYRTNQEIYLAEALRLYLNSGGQLFGWRFRGKRFDCGSKIGLLKAQTYFGFYHPHLKKEFRTYLKTL